MHNVLKWAPWNYQHISLLLHELQPNERPKEELTQLDVWVQVHKLSNGFMSETYARAFGNFNGVFFESDSKNYCICGSGFV